MLLKDAVTKVAWLNICFGSSTAQQTGFLFDPTIDLWLLLGVYSHKLQPIRDPTGINFITRYYNTQETETDTP